MSGEAWTSCGTRWRTGGPIASGRWWTKRRARPRWCWWTARCRRGGSSRRWTRCSWCAGDRRPSARASGRELPHRELQRQTAGRVPQPEPLRLARRSPGRDRGMAAGVQHRAAAPRAGAAAPGRLRGPSHPRRGWGTTHNPPMLTGRRSGGTSPPPGWRCLARAGRRFTAASPTSEAQVTPRVTLAQPT